MRRLLIAGCGDLGIRLGTRLDADWQVHGLRRHPEALPEPIVAEPADLADPDSLARVGGDWDAVVYQPTPEQYDEAGYRAAYCQGLANLFEWVRTPRLVFVSSTAVYGQAAGEWVDEASETRPARFNGRVLLEAEALAADAAPESVVVRFSGIYGPGRDALVVKVAAGRACCRDHPPQWTNRIHAEDCAGVLAHLLTLHRTAPLYCASDSEPAHRCEVLEWLAERLGASAPARETRSGGQGKRISSARLLDSGYRLIHPDYRSGYQEMLQ